MSVTIGASQGLQAKASNWTIAGLVALQILAYAGQSILVTLTKTREGDFAYEATSAVLLTEAIKLFIALCSLVHHGQQHYLALNVFDDYCSPGKDRGRQRGTQQALLAIRSLKRSLVFAMPAFLYVVHNNLIFVAHLYLSAPTYQLLNNIKIITTGVLYRVLLQRRLLVIQWMALLQLSLALACTSLDGQSLGTWSRGALVMVILAICSTLAGVYSEVLIKTSGLPLQAGNAWLYAYSTLGSTLACLWLQPTGRRFLEGFGPAVWATVLTNSVLGMIISFIFKHADNVVKLFGASLAVLVTAAVSSQLFGTHTGPALWLGYSLTVCSLCLYYGSHRVLYSLDSDAFAACSSSRRRRGFEDEEDPKIV